MKTMTITHRWSIHDDDWLKNIRPGDLAHARGNLINDLRFAVSVVHNKHDTEITWMSVMFRGKPDNRIWTAKYHAGALHSIMAVIKMKR